MDGMFKMNKNIAILLEFIFILFMFASGIFIGFKVKEIYFEESCRSIKVFEGCWAQTKNNEDWVCVNIEGMSFQRALEVCRHETFHEIWAECGESNSLDYCIKEHEKEMEKNVTL